MKKSKMLHTEEGISSLHFSTTFSRSHLRKKGGNFRRFNIITNPESQSRKQLDAFRWPPSERQEAFGARCFLS